MYDLDLQFPVGYGHDLLICGQGQRSVGSKDRKYANGRVHGQTGVIALPDLLIWLVLIRLVITEELWPMLPHCCKLRTDLHPR